MRREGDVGSPSTYTTRGGCAEGAPFGGPLVAAIAAGRLLFGGRLFSVREHFGLTSFDHRNVVFGGVNMILLTDQLLAQFGKDSFRGEIDVHLIRS